MRLCTSCQQEKPEEAFPSYVTTVRGKRYTGKRNVCCGCRIERVNAARDLAAAQGFCIRCKRNPAINPTGKASECQFCRAKSKLRDKKRRSPAQVRRERYGISDSEFQTLLLKLDNRCPICRKEFTETCKPYVDHNHETGEIRGLLCMTCNTALGLFYDNPAFCEAAFHYLKETMLYLYESG